MLAHAGEGPVADAVARQGEGEQGSCLQVEAPVDPPGEGMVQEARGGGIHQVDPAVQAGRKPDCSARRESRAGSAGEHIGMPDCLPLSRPAPSPPPPHPPTNHADADHERRVVGVDGDLVAAGQVQHRLHHGVQVEARLCWGWGEVRGGWEMRSEVKGG